MNNTDTAAADQVLTEAQQLVSSILSSLNYDLETGIFTWKKDIGKK
jgi:hypothetical protein